MAKVLLVEDDNNLREIFEMRLQAEGYTTTIASDGEEALVVALREKPDLIIADIMMPKMSGFEMLETLRAAPDMSNIKVIMMTALGQAEDRTRGEKLGVVKYLVKSQVTLEDFVRAVKEVLGSGSADTTQPQPSEQSKSSNLLINNAESEKKMDDQNNQQPNTPTPAEPAPDAAVPGAPSSDADAADSGAPVSNPISGAPSADTDADDQLSTAQAQDAVQAQVDSFAATPGADAGVTPAPDTADTGSADQPADVPVSPPPADQSASGDQPPADGSGGEGQANV